MKIECQPVKKEDINIILDFMKDYYSMEGISFDRDKSVVALENLVSDENIGRIWIIEANRESVGYFCLAFGYSLKHYGKDCILDEIYIKPEYQHLGIGSEVMKFIEDFLIRNEFKAIHLVVHLKNLAAFNYYIKSGFHMHEASFMTKVLKNDDEDNPSD
ncbi:MAG: GNAT family N-acetyltransferase [Bacteroidales bacterium]|nr:GNAT family N-acetyltransferase [Bacteroidales bacterium]